MLPLNVNNETARLKAVILGTAEHNGVTPTAEQAYDPKSLEHIVAGTYPVEKDMIREIDAFNSILKKYAVEVYRPQIINNYNQIFCRDIGFVIDDLFIKANVLSDREKELGAIQYVIDQIDVMLWKDYIFIGTYKGSDYKDYITARTNMEGVAFIKMLFPHKKVKEFDLIKSKLEPKYNALHLDCCFQPVGIDKGIIYKGGFREEGDYEFLVNIFGKENLFHIEREEMYYMNANIFSIAPDVVVSERNFVRLNNWLRDKGYIVEEIPYAEVSKQGGLLRCSTLPLIRE